MEDAINSIELLDRVSDDRELLSELADTFRQDWPVQIERARNALARSDAEDLARVAHTLKGTLANLAANPASKLAAKLEDMARAHNLEHADSRLTELEQELIRVADSIDLLCRGGVH